MSEQTTTKRAYRRISAEHLAYARKRFAEFASTSAVRAELKARGGDYPHNALHYYWTLANRSISRAVNAGLHQGIGRSLAKIEAELLDADADHGPDEARVTT